MKACVDKREQIAQWIQVNTYFLWSFIPSLLPLSLAAVREHNESVSCFYLFPLQFSSSVQEEWKHGYFSIHILSLFQVCWVFLKLQFTFMKKDVNTLLCVPNHPTQLNIMFLSILNFMLGIYVLAHCLHRSMFFCINLWNNLTSLWTTKYSKTYEFNSFKVSWITWRHFHKQQKSQILIFLGFFFCMFVFS